ncbi:DUF4158 domain-containing protein, partial [Nonomuraea dietziae]
MDRSSLNLGDLVEHWTLVGAEQDLVAVKHRDTQLGYALLLQFYGRFGRFPRGRAELHDDAVAFVARQLKVDETRAVAKTTIYRLLSRRDIPLREKTLWRMLYETAARAAEILALNVEDLDLEHRRAPVRSKGGAIEWVYWDSGTAHLLPRLLRLPDGSTRTHGPLFLSERRPVPARRPAAAD